MDEARILGGRRPPWSHSWWRLDHDCVADPGRVAANFSTRNARVEPQERRHQEPQNPAKEQIDRNGQREAIAQWARMTSSLASPFDPMHSA